MNEPRTISRRTVATAMAWAVPALVLSTAGPASASDDAGPPMLTLVGSCRQVHAGDGRYFTFTFMATNTTSWPIVFSAATVASLTTDFDLTPLSVTPTLPLAVAPGSSVEVSVLTHTKVTKTRPFSAAVAFGWGHFEGETEGTASIVAAFPAGQYPKPCTEH